MDLFSLDSVILIVLTCNCLPISYSIFRRHTSWQVLKTERFSASKFENVLREDTPRPPPPPPTRLLPSALAIMPPVTKNLATALKKAMLIIQSEIYIWLVLHSPTTCKALSCYLSCLRSWKNNSGVIPFIVGGNFFSTSFLGCACPTQKVNQEEKALV